MVLPKIKYQILLICALLLAVYYPVVFAPFNTVDDSGLINYLLNLENISLAKLLFPKVSSQYYRPLIMATFVADNYLWGLQASFMHLENILLHIGSAVTVFCIASFILEGDVRRDSPFPLFASLLFGLHPIATEAVDWVSGRTDVLAGLLVLNSFLFFLKGYKKGSYFFVIISSLFLFAGCLSKETALFLIPCLLLWSLLPPSDFPNITTIMFKFTSAGCYIIIALLYLFLRWMSLSINDKILKVMSSSAASNGDRFDIFDILRVSFKTSGFYFKKMVIPTPLNFGIVHISQYYFWLGIIVCSSIVFCIYRHDLLSHLFIASFLLVSPAFILPLMKITWTPVAERYAYIASAPFVIAFTVLVTKNSKLGKYTFVTVFAMLCLVASAGVVTAQRNIIWQDTLSLFEDTVKKSPDFSAARNELAVALYVRNRSSEADELLLGNKGDDFTPSLLNKTKVLINHGHLDDAKKLLLSRDVCDSASLVLLVKIDELIRDGAKLSDVKNIDFEILETLQKLLKITNDPFYFYRIGLVQLRLGQKKAAKKSFYKALQYSKPTSHYYDAAKKLSERL